MDVEAVVKAGIQQEIIKALNESPGYIDSLVKAALNQEVNDYGGKPSYGEDKHPYLEYMVGSQLRAFAGTVIRQWLEDNDDAIRLSIIERMAKVDIAEAFATAVSKQINDNKWGINVQFHRDRI